MHMPIPVERIDHVAITVADLDSALGFYRRVLGAVVTNWYEIDGAVAVAEIHIGGAMLNLHQVGNGVSLVAAKPTPGAIDMCFRWHGPIGTAVEHLDAAGVKIIEGPAPRRARDGQAALSVYFHDQDGNLLELLSTVTA